MTKKLEEEANQKKSEYEKQLLERKEQEEAQKKLFEEKELA